MAQREADEINAVLPNYRYVHAYRVYVQYNNIKIHTYVCILLHLHVHKKDLVRSLNFATLLTRTML